MLVNDAMHKGASTWDWNNAASVALSLGDTASYQTLCGAALARFTSGLEGEYISRIAVPMLLHPQDEIVTRVLIDLVEKDDESSNPSNYAPHMRAWLEYRRGRYQEAHAALDKAAKAPLEKSIGGREFKHFLKCYIDADHFLRAMLFAREGRIIEAQAEFTEAQKLIGPDPTAANPRDLGDGFAAWYQAAAARREAEQVFREKGIPIPQLP